MVHHSCDLCGRVIHEERFVAKIEVAAAFDPDELTEADLDIDHLEEVAAQIESLESTGEFVLEETGPRFFEYDLCRSCCQQYLKSPITPQKRTRLNFSQN